MKNYKPPQFHGPQVLVENESFKTLFGRKKGDRNARCYRSLGTGLNLWLKVYTRVRLLLEWQAEPEKRECGSKTSLKYRAPLASVQVQVARVGDVGLG